MQSPRVPRHSSATLAVTGVALVLASMAFTSRRSARALPEASLAPPSCEYFLRNGADPDHWIDLTAKGVPVILYRTKSYWEDVEQVKSHKKWIGAVKLLQNPTPHAFPNLTPAHRGCLEFKASRVTQGEAKHAQLYDSTGTLLHTYKGRWLCQVDEHPSNATPDWETYPDACTRMTLWIKPKSGRDIPIVSPRLPGAQTIQIAAFMTLVESTLRSHGVGPAERKKIRDAMSLPGPWYPCAQTGCCRAFDYD